VIDRGREGAWDHMAVDNPYLFVQDDTIYCFYEGQDKPFEQGGAERIGLAVSRDGVEWEKSPVNPIIDIGPEGSWDSIVAKLPVVTRHQGQCFLFYSGREGKTKQIGLATSKDLTYWTKHPANPVLPSRPGNWDAFISTYPAKPVYHDGRFCLLYRGMRSMYTAQGLGLAVSSDLVHWTRFQDGPVIDVREEVASFALARDQRGFIAIAQAPERRYWLSQDLTNWRKGPAADFTGPKLSTVSNPVHFKGEWLVVYEQDDRIYRAVPAQAAGTE
jgi:hypothetical protein